MIADRIEGRDIDNDGFIAWRGKLCDEAGAVVTLRIDTASQILHLDAKEAARIGIFLLEAAGVDLVSAARKVKEAREEVERYNRGGSTNQYIGAAGDLCEEVDALAAELAKLNQKGSDT